MVFFLSLFSCSYTFFKYFFLQLLFILIALFVFTFPAPAAQTPAKKDITYLSLTDQERQWLKQHPQIKMGIDRDFAPFEWLDAKQQYKGMSADYIDILQRILGVEFILIKNKNWQEILDMAKNNELDMLSNANKTPERERYLSFTRPYIFSPVVIISDGKNGFIGNLKNLKTKTIALESGYFMQDILRSQFPQINVLATDNELQALKLLRQGKVDAYIGDAIATHYAIQKANFFNLRFSGQTKFHSEHRMAVSLKHPLLHSILQKALDSIPVEQHQHILNKWQGVHFNRGIQRDVIINYAILIGCLFLLFSYWLYRLKKEIQSRKKSEQALRESELRFRQVFENTDAISVQGYNKQHRVIYWNPASEQLYGYTAQQALGEKLEDLIIPNDIKVMVEQGIDNWIDKGERIPSAEVTLQHQNGSPIHVFSSHVLLSNIDNVPELYCIDIDLTLRKQQEERIQRQAHFDALTDLPNRFLVLDRLTQMIIEAKRNESFIAVLFLDLDDFKKVNDTLGHETGDQLLVKAAQRLCDAVRSSDTVGRLGGDEFIILLSGLSDKSEIEPICENIINQFRRPFKIEARELILTASIGIALYPDDGISTSELLRNADSAMYNSKDNGRNNYSYYMNSMNQGVSRRLALEEQIHGALERNEFYLVYQAKVAFNDEHIIGAEALLRWHNPVLGQVSPEEFIPIAEQTGLIIPIGLFVLNTALKQTLFWQQSIAPDFNIAVNLSPRQFRDPQLVETIRQSIEQNAIAAHSLELEITEGILMSGHSYIDDTLKDINQMGISISMDDFGTGYSSLSYLRKYPFSILKIDRSFINDITTDENDRELINAVVAMAHALNLKVVAEGVETKAQRDYLVSIKCDIAQGYYYSKPVSATEFSQLLST